MCVCPLCVQALHLCGTSLEEARAAGWLQPGRPGEHLTAAPAHFTEVARAHPVECAHSLPACACACVYAYAFTALVPPKYMHPFQLACTHALACLPSALCMQIWALFRLQLVHWGQWAHSLPSLLGMIFVVAFSSSLDVAAIEMEMKTSLDINSELQTVGWANLASGLLGGCSHAIHAHID